jgi:hypothetical protein
VSSAEPLLRVVRGEPDDAEVAALTAVVSALAAAASAAADDLRPPWSNPRALVRPSMSHGRGAWRASGMPG